MAITSYQDSVWGNWVDDYYSGTSYSTGTDAYTTTDNGMSTGQDGVWTTWVNSGGSITYVTRDVQIAKDVTWKAWVTDYEVEIGTSKVTYIEGVKAWQYHKTVEQKRAIAAQREIDLVWSKLLTEEREEEQKLAEVTAHELLQEIVSDVELSHYKEHGELLVRGRKHDYIIKKRGGVIRVEKDKVLSLCIHLNNQYKYPRTDNVIALKLAIDADEHKFNKDANASSMYSKKTMQEWRDKVERIKRVA
jgi:aminoglycoside phosphotransferase family enzyme